VRLGLSIPLYNEETLIAQVVAALQSTLDDAKIEYTLVLVDNGSTDGTGTIIEDLARGDNVEAIHLPKNAGYGGGILAGLHHLRQCGMTDAVGWYWGDGQVSANALPPLFQAIKDGADLAKAHRIERQESLNRRVIARAYASIMWLAGVKTPDVNGCPKLMSRATLEALQPSSTDWFIDAEVVIGAEERGLVIASHPTTMLRRQGGASKVKVRTLIEFFWNILRWKLGLQRPSPSANQPE
jgi:glycosyltransferase involved in cell wall biosynthesis